MEPLKNIRVGLYKFTDIDEGSNINKWIDIDATDPRTLREIDPELYRWDGELSVYYEWDGASYQFRTGDLGNVFFGYANDRRQRIVLPYPDWFWDMTPRQVVRRCFRLWIWRQENRLTAEKSAPACKSRTRRLDQRTRGRD